MPSDCQVYLAGIQRASQATSDDDFETKARQYRAGVAAFFESEAGQRFFRENSGRPQPRPQANDAIETMLNSVALVLFKCAWPTAVYDRFELLDAPEFDVNISKGRASAVGVKLHGKSSFNDGPLYVKIVLEVSFQSGEARPIRMRFGENNAILAQPGTTLRSNFVRDLSPQFQDVVEKVCPNPP